MKTKGKRLILALWLATLLACGIIIARTSFVSDLSAFMPKAPSSRQQVLIDQFHDGIIARLIMIGIEGGDATERARLSLELGTRLRTSGLFVGVQNGDVATEQRDHAYFFDNRYLLSPDISPELFTVAGLHNAIGDSIDALSGNVGLILKKLFPRDPTGETLQLLEQFAGNNQPRNLNGVWASRNGTRAVLLAYTRAPGTDTEAQAHAVDFIRQTFDKLPDRQSSIHIAMSGTGVFSVKSRNTIEGQVTKLATASLALVICLLLLVYRSPRLLLLGLLPVLSGALAGVAAVSLIFGQVHGLTLGFGTTLIGEAVDYSIYFYLQRAGHLDPNHFWRTLWLGVSTSMAGFATLLFSGFPGLSQLGVYSLTGLISAAIVTRFVLSALLPRQLNLRDLSRAGWVLDTLLCHAARLRWVPVMLTLGACSVILAHSEKMWNRNLATLSPISKEDQECDLQLRNDLGSSDLRFMVVFTATNEEPALQGAEQVGTILRRLVRDKEIAGFNSPAFALPSLALQRAHQQDIPPAEEMRQRLQQALHGLPVTIDKLQGFLTDLQTTRTRPLLQRADLDGTSAALLVDSLLIKRPADTLVLMPLRPLNGSADTPLDINHVESVLQSARLAHPIVIDLLEESTRLFENYRQEILLQSGFGCFIICALLLGTLKSVSRTLRVVTPLFCAVVCDTAAILLSGTQLTILHLVGLLLVVAIGSNYALFFEGAERSQSAAERRQMQVSLVVATLTTVGSFGVLGRSSLPVLSAIGNTVSLGALFSFIFSAILTRGKNKMAMP
ncbi:MAG: MMPL family transporter [Ferrovum sp.]|nr:MMPL family transporter [Ferrovum sp.]